MNFVAVLRKHKTRRPLGFDEQCGRFCSLKGPIDVCFITGATPRIFETAKHKAAKSEG